MSLTPAVSMHMDAFEGQQQAGASVHRIVEHTDLPRHDHVFHEIVYIESGTAKHETAEGIQELRAGDLLVFRPYTWHAYIDTRQLRLINCLFDSRIPRRFAHLLRSVPGSFDLYHRRGRGVQKPVVLRCRPAQRTALVQRFESIMAEQTEAVPGWQMAVTIGVLDVLLITARLWARQWKPLPVEVSIRTEQAVLAAVTYLEDHYTEAVDLDELANRVHLSRWYLSRSFNRLMGMSVTGFVHRLRVEEACRRLRLTDQAIGRIAGELGYDELPYFSRCFHKHVGKSPRDYRQALDDRHSARI